MARQSKRTYDATSRQEQAARTRARILDVSRRLLLRDGYAATTIARIAKDAGVSAESIYKTFGGKPGLVRAIQQAALAGSGPVHAEHRSDAMQREARSPQAIVRGWATLSTEVAPRVAPILLLVGEAAAHDAEMAQLQAELDTARLARMAHNARSLPVPQAYARDVLWFLTAPEVYDLLIQRRGWSLDDYGRFLGDCMTGTLLSGTPATRRSPRSRRAATRRRRTGSASPG
jgi:AcrR family transcriptional regulator